MLEKLRDLPELRAHAKARVKCPDVWYGMFTGHIIQLEARRRSAQSAPL